LIGSAPVDLLRSRLDRKAWTVTVEVVTPAPDDEEARDRVLMLADALRDDDRVAALTLTDRTVAPDADPIALAPDVALRSGKAPLVHLAGKGRDRRAIEATLRRAADAGITSLLLTSGDVEPPERAGVSPGARDSNERAGVSPGARDLLTLARTVAPGILRLGVLDDAYDRAVAKRDAGAAGLIAQVSWDLGARETTASWQKQLGVPIIGAVMLLTRGRLEFLARHRIGGIVMPPALRHRAERELLAAAMHRLALDLVMLRRLGYAGAHVSGLLSPARVTALLDDAARLDASLGDDWREVWREAVGIA
jgi:methylenetetrahydrofolate reductase (NADPH)